MLRYILIIALVVGAFESGAFVVRAHEATESASPVAHTAGLLSGTLPPITTDLSGTKLMHAPSGDVEAQRIVRVGKHMHSIRDELIYVVSGNGSVLVGNKTFAVGPGDVISIPHQTPHQITASQGAMNVIFIAYPEDEPKDWIAL